ncbi:uncharacterized protein AC631_03409 [Debaryomyces fabryi]|uniref:DNA repair metallo-beta-lactamase domain-containing protein n=1 Tax=Debaryomyces fabryi TaxID=58627 RepID=A0A0V1PXH8_9ASCO|nr:uncharacterized protein AC631_03409 [Debaryomyces fabryi]KSA00818.1 hypothetical protein AC631_03409 [Debaryomyces fabryi]CUM52015.1 unnamed protein product [Debaryomyces fabryi]
MSVNQKKSSIISKRQRSIFEFTQTGNDIEVQNRFDSCEVIDLTDDGEGVKLENEVNPGIQSMEAREADFEQVNDRDKTIERNEPDVEEVSCPMCNRSLVDFSMDNRILHIEECLSLITLKEEVSTTNNESRDIKKEKTNETAKKDINIPRNKRKNGSLLPQDKEKEKYINKKAKIEDSKPKVIKPPTAISASRAKAQIPEVKILTFPSSEQTNYQIAVDAFNYSLHESIKKYFLTHFHSDHYGGITKKWCYERVFKNGDDFEDENKYKKIIFCSEITGRLLTLRFSIDTKFIMPLQINRRYLIQKYDTEFETEDDFIQTEDMTLPGLFVTPITANHCPGSVIFLFESLSNNGYKKRTLHCGDFRVNREILDHPRLLPFNIAKNDNLSLDQVYLDTTYMSPSYNFPKQELVCKTVSDMFYDLINSQEEAESTDSLFTTWFGVLKQSRITDFIAKRDSQCKKKKFLILIGTYVIGKERLAISILQRLGNCPIYVLTINSRNDKVDLVKSFDNIYLNQVLTNDDIGRSDSECMVHLVPMKIVSSIEELSNYFNHNRYFEKFERCVGLRPTGWSFLNKYASTLREEVQEDENESKYISDLRNVNSCNDLVKIMKTQPTFSFIENILPQSPLLSLISKSKKSSHDESLYRIYTLPYSEHSSFRELSFFAVFLKIKEIIPTVNISNESSITEMARIIRNWELIRENKMAQYHNRGLESKIAQGIEDLCIEDF